MVKKVMRGVLVISFLAMSASNYGCVGEAVMAGIAVADLAIQTGADAALAKNDFEKSGDTSTPIDVVWEATQLATKELGIIEDNKKFGDKEAEFGGHIGELDYIRIYLYKLTPENTKVAIQSRTALLPMTKNGYDFNYAQKIIDSINNNLKNVVKKERAEDKEYKNIEKVNISQGNGTKVDFSKYFDNKNIMRNYTAIVEVNNKQQSIQSSAKTIGERIINGKNTTPEQYEITYLQTGKKVSELSFYVSDDNGYYKYAEQKNDMIEPKLLDKPDFVIKSPSTVGLQWEYENKTIFLARKISLPSIVTIEKNDDVVSVPAGTFENCLRIKVYCNVENDKGYKIKKESYVWYAPGVGYIKSILKEESTDPSLGTGGTLTDQLASYSK